jgi:hypothetical protein
MVGMNESVGKRKNPESITLFLGQKLALDPCGPDTSLPCGLRHTDLGSGSGLTANRAQGNNLGILFGLQHSGFPRITPAIWPSSLVCVPVKLPSREASKAASLISRG